MNLFVPALAILATLIPFVSSSAAPSDPVISVGVTLDLAGPAAAWSKYQRLGLELAAEDLRKEGHDIRLSFENSGSEPSQAVRNFTGFLTNGRTRAVIGDIFPHVTSPLIALASKREKLLISPSSPEKLCAGGNGFFFSTGSQVALSSEGYAEYLSLNPETKRVALVYLQDPGWGYQYRDTWRTLLKTRGVRISGEFGSAEAAPDFEAALERLMQFTPDAIFVAHEPKAFIAAARAKGYKGDMVFANNILGVVASGQGADSLEGIYFVDTVAKGDFQERFEQRFKEPMVLEPYNGYEALRLLVKALASEPVTPERAIPGLQYEGISGPMDFSQSCAGNRSRWHLKRFQSGTVTLLGKGLS